MQAPKSYSKCHCCAWASRCVFCARELQPSAFVTPLRRKKEGRNNQDQEIDQSVSACFAPAGCLFVRATLPTMAMRCLAVLLLVSFLHTRDMLHNTARALTHHSLGRSPRARVYATPRRTRLLTARPCAGRRSRGFHGGQRLRCHLDHGERPGGDAQVLRRRHYKAGVCFQRAVSRPV